MRSVAVVVIVAGLGLGLSCVGISPASAANCDGNGACKVDVSVTSCNITPTPPSLLVTGKNIVIFWELDATSTSSYRFRDGDGVVLKSASSEFDQAGAQANNKKFKLHDKNSLSGEHSYPYTINVQRFMSPNWVDCPPLDPTIVNKG